MQKRAVFCRSLVILVFGFIWLLPQLGTQLVSSEAQPGPDITAAVTLYYENKIDACLEKFRSLAVANPDDIPVRLNLIRVLREAGKYSEAIAQSNSLLRQNPEDPRIRLIALQAAYLAGKPDETVKMIPKENLKGEEFYWYGLALADLGREDEARQMLEDYLAFPSYNPMAFFKLGQLYRKSANYAAAMTFYRKALTQEPELTIVFYPLAQTYIALGDYQSAYYFLCNATSICPWNKDLSTAFQKLVSKHPEVLNQPPAKEESPKVIIPPQVTPVPEGQVQIPQIRIGLAERVIRAFVKTGDQFLVVNPTGSKKFQGEPQMLLDIRSIDGFVKIYDQYGTLLIKSTLGLTLTYANPGATTALFEVSYGRGRYWAGRETRTYRGKLEFLVKPAGLTVVNQLNLEEYLYGVVPGEMEYDWPMSALEAQAIAARTYAVANTGEFKSRGFDLYATVISQVYDGVSIENQSTNAAVDATRGKVLIYNQQPIAAFYNGNSGGYTASSFDIWGLDLPYLQAIPDKLLPPRTGPLAPEELAEWLTAAPPTYSSNPKYANRSHYRWVLWVPHTSLEGYLKKSARIGRFIAIKVTRRSPGGIVKKVLIKGTTGQYVITGDAIRAKLDLRSNLFIVEPKIGTDGLPEYFIFTGGGWGHGVGMCQCGAAGMADDGFTYEEILNHYYPGTELKTLY